MKKVKELEREGCRRAKHRGREPACAKELNFMRRRIGRTMTVLKDDTVDSVQVKDHVIGRIGGVGTAVAVMTTKLNDVTKRGKSSWLKELAGPFLMAAVSGRSGGPTKKNVPRVNGAEGTYGLREHILYTSPRRQNIPCSDTQLQSCTFYRNPSSSFD